MGRQALTRCQRDRYTATASIVLSGSVFVIVFDTMAAQGDPLYAMAAAIGFVLRLGFTILFFLADLQIFFAASMAIIGGLTVAKTVTARNLSIAALAASSGN